MGCAHGSHGQQEVELLLLLQTRGFWLSFRRSHPVPSCWVCSPRQQGSVLALSPMMGTSMVQGCSLGPCACPAAELWWELAAPHPGHPEKSLGKFTRDFLFKRMGSESTQDRHKYLISTPREGSLGKGSLRGDLRCSAVRNEPFEAPDRGCCQRQPDQMDGSAVARGPLCPCRGIPSSQSCP